MINAKSEEALAISTLGVPYGPLSPSQKIIFLSMACKDSRVYFSLLAGDLREEIMKIIIKYYEVRNARSLNRIWLRALF